MHLKASFLVIIIIDDDDDANNNNNNNSNTLIWSFLLSLLYIYCHECL